MRAFTSTLLSLIFCGLVACGGGDKPKTTGGAILQLGNVTGGTGLTNCQDLNGKLQLAVVVKQDGGPDEQYQLVDGQDGAAVSCRASATSFQFTLSLSGYYFTAQGTLQGTQSSDTTVSMALASGASYQTPGTATDPAKDRCQVTVTKHDGGEFAGHISCGRLINPLLSNVACALPATPTNQDLNYFRFLNCAG